MQDMTIPAPIYRAFKTLPQQKGSVKAYDRIAEFIRLGCTAYDFTLTYSNRYIVIHAEWPKPKDMGNEHEGWYRYLDRAAFTRLDYDPKNGATYPITDEPDTTFVGGDILKPGLLDSYLDLANHSQQKRNNGKISLSKQVNPTYLSTVLKVCATICKGGAKDGTTEGVTLDIGSNPVGPVVVRSYVPKHGLSLTALVMPIRS